jgi:hydrogenase nickel incorporation protein HypA/HybF
MHELGIMINVINSIEKIAAENGVTKVATLVLQVGELSPVVPHYLKAVFPAAVDGTLLQDTKLEIEVIPGNGVCKHCGSEFNLIACNKTCPDCGHAEWDLISGTEFLIKEITAW